MRQCIDTKKVQSRIKKIEGQLRAISEMVDKDIPCEDILIQRNAAKSALHKVGQVVLEGHLQHCVRDGIEHGDADRTIAEFAKAVEHFSRMG
ncbi:metal-sensing transcriptional repressor [Serpentinicella alkaliphila]|uniref:DNA-binding FrmR family transcriptional regulator n=1 Tax=Serpentinicella alkaliphila TaxID=1734049 RepID=A0A4R2TPQ0_9FIRM|nr:metal-sensing transcriptional repressor [Serpentinicella alkaliphila]QUH24492.1 metal-sensing transcriptional repressor [Serpentinicella alkaliphila]TCP96962.1 DNA-binding FrmR family transcriptional regulator [Serpentinicella alkaliphila]